MFVGLISNQNILASYATAAAAYISLQVAVLPSSEPVVATEPIPVLEVVKIYGRLAGPACFGRAAPAGSSCQITRSELEEKLGLSGAVTSTSALSRDDFAARLGKLSFQWPLKPFGIERSTDKTALMNKGAETRTFMEELEARRLYDRRYPTGPLPTSLRPKLNAEIQKEGISMAAIQKVFDSICSRAGTATSPCRELTAPQLIDGLFEGDREEIDYYDFLRTVGENNIVWPS